MDTYFSHFHWLASPRSSLWQISLPYPPTSWFIHSLLLSVTLGSLFYKGFNPIHQWFILTTQQLPKSHILILFLCGLGFQYRNFEGCKHSVYSSSKLVKGVELREKRKSRAEDSSLASWLSLEITDDCCSSSHHHYVLTCQHTYKKDRK